MSNARPNALERMPRTEAARHDNAAAPKSAPAGGAALSAALDLQAANVYLGLAPKSNWLLQPGCPVARCDMRRPDAKRPLWRWRRATLDAFLAAREVAPGETNPQDPELAYMFGE